MFGTLTLVSLLYPLQLRSDYASASQLLTPLSSLSVTSTIGQIKLAIGEAAVQYGIEPSELMTTIKCESSFDVSIFGDHGLAYGLLQFHKDTFDGLCEGNYYSPKDQLVCASKLWAKNPKYKLLWSCWKHYFLN